MFHKALLDTFLGTIKDGRIAHAQLFHGKLGYGVFPLVVEYAAKILSIDNEDAYYRAKKFIHPDLHFSFPVVSSSDSKKENYRAELLKNFKEMMLELPTSSLADWYQKIQVGNKQGIINVDETEYFINKLQLASYEGGFKILIIWMAEKMNTQAANKFLKFLEEPDPNTKIFLICEDISDMLPTILSRCQIHKIPKFSNEEIVQELTKNYEITREDANFIAFQANGDWNEALKIVENHEERLEFEEIFVQWTRTAFKAAKNFKALAELQVLSAKVADFGREKQKRFLSFCTEVFRQALLKNYQLHSLVNKEVKVENFNFSNFSTYIHGANIPEILDMLSKAEYCIERNAHAKITFTNLFIELIRKLHTPAKYA